jgi:hypothetical protein
MEAFPVLSPRAGVSRPLSCVGHVSADVQRRAISRCFSAALVLITLLLVGVGQRASGQNAAAVTNAVRPLITHPLDESQLTTLKGNVHPLARPVYDVGTAPATLPMERMLLVLKRSADQETELRRLLDSQQDKKSPNYHRWVTPEQFGKQFGPSDDDIQKITTWLQSHGFQVGTTKGRTMLEFSGSASQVKDAFHTTIHKYVVKGEQHWANASDPMIPTALTPAVAGVMTLHNFLSKPQSRIVESNVPAVVVPGSKPDVTFTSNGQVIHALAPQDYAVIYNIGPVYSMPPSGLGVTIGVIARNDLFNGSEDVSTFHDTIGFANNSFGGGNPTVIVNGPDPGNVGGGEEGEATLDATWSSALAPNATIDFVVSGSTNTTDGIDLSELYIVENNLTDIMTESFGTCEYYATDARLAGITALAEQAAAQGISYFVSTGDNGAEGCDAPSNPPARNPVSVNALASTAFNVAVGGTMFNDTSNSSKYWASTAPISETALSYIPENVWNESSSTNGLWAGSGGASAGNLGDVQISPAGTTGGVAKPAWQFGAGLNIPQDDVRDLPDVSLTAAGHDAYLLCLEGSCVPDSQNRIRVFLVSGTSASAPSFAGIMALIDQSQGGRQGQPNYELYSLAAAQAAQGIYPSQCNGSSTSAAPAGACIFNDVTVGNNVVPGEIGTSYQAGAGYDLATGLGSVNVANLVSNWSTANFNATTTTLSISPLNLTHGQSVTVSANVTAASGTPTGDVVLYTSNGLAPSTLDLYHLSGAGTASGSTTSLPGSRSGTYNVWAHYSGDGTYSPSDSGPVVVKVNPEPSTTSLSLQASDLSGHPISSPYPFGSLVFVRADVAGNSGHGIPTGTVAFTDTFGPIPTANPQVSPPVAVVSNPPLNSQGNTSIGDGIISFDAGNHSISASYNGDASFNASSSSAPVTFTVAPGFAGISGPTSVSIASPGQSGTSKVGFITSTGFNTAIALTCAGLPAEAQCSSTSVTGAGPVTPVTATITITTTAPHTASLGSSERRYYLAVLVGGLPLAGILLIAAPRRRGWSVLLAVIMLIALASVPGCGGGGGGGGSSSHQDPGTPAGTYPITVTATAGSLSESGQFTLVVQ